MRSRFFLLNVTGQNLHTNRYPGRPHNRSATLPFHSLFEDLFTPLHETKAPKASVINRRKVGPNSGQSTSVTEKRRAIIERFISRWRREVGDDIYPAFRLIIPDKDRDRAMYGLKEKVLARYFVKVMKIDKNSEDAQNLLNWKTANTEAAGNFPGRCYEVISKRPVRVEVGDMTIGEVNDQLDKLSAAAKEENQLPIMAEFYQRMNAEELMWLVKIILRQMKVGATEKTFFNVWHPDAESLFNISSSLRRVCWELHNPHVRLEGEDRGVSLMQCFQPQLAQFQVQDFNKMVAKMRPTEHDDEFWIEEKLDGERMQLHMVIDDDVPGKRSFKFWSRKAKDYTYLYGADLYDKNSSLTRHIKDAFAEDVESIILDGEMITWDMDQDKICAFGTLKTAALAEQRNEYALTPRPLFRVFDILFLNSRPLTQYTLRDRRKALERSLKPVHRRIEIQSHDIGRTKEDIESHLREIITEASEGLVIKNPRSAYRLNDRNDDWMKVKPEYMQEYGENLDCVIIGGYFGSGRRGGGLSSFMCGLRADESKPGSNPERFVSFFKVGGGMKANDYAQIKHMTDGKWKDWDPKKPPTDWIELAGGPLQKERPDQWIKPSESIVIEVKGASVAQSDEFAFGLTLRFPRFKRLRQDKDWQSALSTQGFLDMKANVEAELEHKKQLKVDRSRKKRKIERKEPPKVVGYGRGVNSIKIDNVAGMGYVFANVTFYIMTDATAPEKKSKNELEAIVKAHGGRIVQNHTVKDTEVQCIADRNTVKVASQRKKGDTTIIKPIWIFDCIEQAKKDFARGLPERVILWEPGRHFYHASDEEIELAENNVDQYGDAYYRDTTADELRTLMSKMKDVPKLPKSEADSITNAFDPESLPGWMFKGKTIFFDNGNSVVNGLNMPPQEHQDIFSARITASFAGAMFSNDIEDRNITHIVVSPLSDVRAIRRGMSTRKKIPRVVTTKWVKESWEEKTLLDEEGFVPL